MLERQDFGDDHRLWHAYRAAMALADVMNHHYGRDYHVSWDESEFTAQAYDRLEDDPAAIKLEVDRKCDHLAQAYLNGLYPDHGFVGEESFRPSEMDKPLFWCVDPICGSMGYYRRSGFFGTSIALVDHEAGPLVGVVNCPGLHQTGAASVEESRLLLDGARMSTALAGLRLVSSANLKKNELMNELIRALDPDEVEYQESVPTKSLGVLTGRFDLNFGLPKKAAGTGLKIWDVAASEVLYRAAGKCLVDFDGHPLHVTGASPLRFENGYILARDMFVVDNLITTYHRVMGA
jgi:fructose-1,6-bisphosphatase/inositol monophosphatase family enzyme